MYFIFSYTILYILIHKIYDAAHLLWPRLLLIPIFILLYFYKDKIDEKLKFSSTNLKLENFLKYFSITLLLARFIQFIVRLTKPVQNLEDIAYLYYESINAFFNKFQNPYKISFDPYEVVMKDGVIKIFSGLKYPPLQLFTYYPFVKLFDLKGFYVAHLFYYALFLIFIYRFLIKFSKTHAYLGIIWLLLTDYFFTLSFNKATNDFLPTLLILYFCYYLFKNKKTNAAVILALSILSKQLPGMLFGYILFLQKNLKLLIQSLLLILLITLPFILWDHYSFLSNLIEFPLVRPSRPSSFLVYFSDFNQKLLQLFGLISISILSLIGNRFKNWNAKENWQVHFFCLLIFLVFSKMSPTNYFLWVTPLTVFWMLTPRQ